MSYAKQHLEETARIAATLDISAIENMVRHLAEVDRTPGDWTCPHGRPRRR